MARQKDVLISRLPKKGKIEDTIKGEIKVLSIAYHLRVSTIFLQEELKKVEEAVENERLEERRYISHYKVNMCDMNTHILKASVLLDNDGWVSRVNISFEPT